MEEYGEPVPDVEIIEGIHPEPRNVWGFWPTFGFSVLIGVVILGAESFLVLAFILGNIQELTSEPFQFLEELMFDGQLLVISTIVSSVVGTKTCFPSSVSTVK